MKIWWLIGIILLIGSGCEVNPSERNNAGNSLYDQTDYLNAIRAYQAAQVAAPDSPEAYYNAASAYSRAGEFEKAINALKQSLKTADLNLIARAQYNLGNIYFEMRRFNDAINAYQQVLLLQPNDEDARHNLELAMNQIIATPSPTLLLVPATEEGGIGGTTLTNEPATHQTATPSNSNSSMQTETSTQAPDSNDIPPTYSVEDAERLLDAVQQSQAIFPNQTITGTPSSSKSDKDW